MVIRLGVAVVVAVFATARAADAQPGGEIHRIGYLGGSSAPTSARFVDAFRQGLRELGWVEGQNVIINYRFADGRLDRLPELAAELVRLKVDVIVAGPSPPAVAARRATATTATRSRC